MIKIKELNLGVIDYEEAYQLQLQQHELCFKGEFAGAILRLEHKNVYTLGKNLFTQQYPPIINGTKVIRTNRGGQITAHMLGQLVVYPILDIKVFGFSPKSYVNFLENLIISALQKIGISAATNSAYPGVWVGNEKIAALGLRIKNRVTLHGISVNVCNEMNLFRDIVPCGIKDRGVTTIQNILRAQNKNSDEINAITPEKFYQLLGFKNALIKSIK
jgi:lipoate-protein ligase B